jgi:hypothetical protein
MKTGREKTEVKIIEKISKTITTKKHKRQQVIKRIKRNDTATTTTTTTTNRSYNIVATGVGCAHNYPFIV